MKLVVTSLFAALVLFAAGQDATRSTAQKPPADKNKTATNAKDADAWMEVFPKRGPAETAPGWTDVWSAIEKRYGKGKVSCRIFDSAREKYFVDFVGAGAIKQGFGIETTRQQFMKATDLPTAWTLTGRKRQGCVE